VLVLLKKEVRRKITCSAVATERTRPGERGSSETVSQVESDMTKKKVEIDSNREKPRGGDLRGGKTLKRGGVATTFKRRRLPA